MHLEGREGLTRLSSLVFPSLKRYTRDMNEQTLQPKLTWKQKLIAWVFKDAISAVWQVAQTQKMQSDYLIAIARLTFLKPEVLNREVKNVKANAEYLVRLIEAERGTHVGRKSDQSVPSEDTENR